MSEGETITDAKGRKLLVKDLTVLQQARLLRAVGWPQSQNQPYFQLVECAAMVSELDGTPVPMPMNERQIDGALERLGDDGMAAVMVFRMRKIQEAMKAAEDAVDGVVPDPLAPSASSPSSAPSANASSSSTTG